MAADFEYRIAETREDIEGAVRLVYRNYVELKYCNLNRFGVHFYLYDVLPETRTLVALHGERVVATLTLVFDSALGLPSGKLYPAELEALRDAGRRLVEVSKLSVDRDLGARGLAVLKGLFRLGWLVSARVHGSTDFVIMVEPHHERFYARSLLFERAGELKPDPEAADAPSVLLRLRLAEAPERYRAAFGEEPREANPYWYFVLAPEVAAVEAAARAADSRLSEMNRLVETGRRRPDPTPAERRYMDYRLFSIAFVTDKTCKEAERRAQKGLFRSEIEAYDRLLAALPPDYAPERRGSILVQMAKALWHGGMYERVLELTDQALEILVDPDLRGDAAHMRAIGLQFLGRNREARETVARALEDTRLSDFMTAKLLRTDGRFAIGRLAFDDARARLREARERTAAIGDGGPARLLRAYLAHDIHVLEYRSGRVTAALAELEASVPLFEAAGPLASIQYHEGMSKLESIRLRPEAALEHAAAAMRAETADTSRYDAAIFRFVSAEACLTMGRLGEARRFAGESLALARRARQPGLIAEAVGLLTDVALAAGERDEAGRIVVEFRGEAGATGAPGAPGAEAALAAARGRLAVAGRRWAEARELCRSAAELLGPEPARGALALCARVEVELLAGAGAGDEAARLAAKLPEPGSMPGHLAYEARLRTLRATLLGLAGDGPGAERELSRALGLYRPGGCLRDMAEAGLFVLEALSAGCAAERCPALRALAQTGVRSALDGAGLPDCERRLAGLRSVPG